MKLIKTQESNLFKQKEEKNKINKVQACNFLQIII